ncbi:nucleotidyl transferase AbiEii/AbiGii toxin family protein [Lacihabitans sp. LS3-19]|uniref:nucleotidyl transferase AbiEii/AbiGii toxin family protein n=1 Tax=Lacihabitans sp. LS3-19 TaxID=2487335 RepID=UPI0020CF73D3|nr:nucleotidyl transferase AbiEii/AbiGii toxin family protein [Lacihabitans sp. LS3-19]
MDLEVLQDFYLVGGTALALQKGHRFSIDLDLFTPNSFDNEQLIEKLKETFGSFILKSEGKQLIFAEIDNVKVDLVKMNYPILYESTFNQNIRMLHINDIAPMKLKAIVQRGSKKDFFDIYYILQEMSLNTLIELYIRKFNQNEIFHVLKSLSYFEDAENDFNPIVFDSNIDWNKVKEFLKFELFKFTK